MCVNPIRVCFIVIFLIFPMTFSEDEVVKQALVRFMDKLAPGNSQRNAKFWGWNLASDPCSDSWHGVSCIRGKVNTIVLDDCSFNGTLDTSSLCMANSLQSLSLKRNNLHGLIPEDIGTCKSLTQLYLSDNSFSGDLPTSLAELDNLKRLHVASNNFSGELSNVIHLSGLISFLAENNKFIGEIPDFNFSKLLEFNVSNNNLEGSVPDDVSGAFYAESFSGNPNLCGTPLPKACPPIPPPHSQKETESFIDNLGSYSGYFVLGLIVLFSFACILARKFKTKGKALIVEKKKLAREISFETKSGTGTRSKCSMASLESGMNISLSSSSSSTLVVFSSPASKRLQLEDLLRAPAELIGRGKHGSLFKVMLDNGVLLAVKRINDWGISKQDFERRINKIGQVKHPHVMPLVAYYCSPQEKLLVYEYMENGSLFQMLLGSPSGHFFKWGSRLKVAAKIAEALAYMHEELHGSGIAHGNIKSSNILFGKNMNPCISEYGLMVVEDQGQSAISHGRRFKNKSLATSHAYSTFKVDTYAYGVILLELLTGKVVQNNGFNLVEWVNSVIREELTVEVFDKSLIAQGASEERMVNLLHVALQCTNPSPNYRPSMSDSAAMTIALKEEEEISETFNS